MRAKETHAERREYREGVQHFSEIIGEPSRMKIVLALLQGEMCVLSLSVGSVRRDAERRQSSAEGAAREQSGDHH